LKIISEIEEKGEGKTKPLKDLPSPDPGTHTSQDQEAFGEKS
jgi:hypothetical protein